MWTNTTGKRWFVNKDGKAVDENDPGALGLIVGIDGQLTEEEARKYGLDKQAAAPVQTTIDDAEQQSMDDAGQKAESAPPNKSKAPPENKKG